MSENRGKYQPIFPTLQDERAYPSRLGLVQAAFITIRNAVGLFPLELRGPESETLAEIDYCSRTRSYTSTGIDFALDGFVLSKTTKGGLVDYSHRLKVSADGGRPEYHRESFNEDPQCLPAKTLNLVGEKDISTNPDAVVELLSFERDVLYGAMTRWEGYATRALPTASC